MSFSARETTTPCVDCLKAKRERIPEGAAPTEATPGTSRTARITIVSITPGAIAMPSVLMSDILVIPHFCFDEVSINPTFNKRIHT